MNKIWTITGNELRTLFYTPLAYIILFVTIFIFNIFFYLIIDQNQEAVLRDICMVMEFMFVFVIPLLTMRLIAQERETSTFEFLLTSPVKSGDVVVGKFLGTWIFFSLMIAINILYYIIFEIYAQPDRWAVISGIFGLWLEGAFFIAIGLCASSFTRNQVIAAITAYLTIFFLYFSFSFISYFNGPLATVIRYMATLTHTENFSSGLIYAHDVFYYVTGTIFFLFLSRIGVEYR